MVLLWGNVPELLFSKENEIISIILTHLRLLSNTDKKKKNGPRKKREIFCLNLHLWFALEESHYLQYV